MDDIKVRRELYNGFGDGLARAFEMAVTPALFGAAGFGLDRLFGVFPVLTFVLGLFGVVGMFVRTWYHYDADMRRHEEAGAWRRAGDTR